VNVLLAAGIRQTVHNRLKAGTLRGILNQGKWRFPLWPFCQMSIRLTGGVNLVDR
jgi:hypothetical protein